MSVELTSSVMDNLPVTPQKNQGDEHPPIKKLTDLDQVVESRLSGTKASKVTQNVDLLSKKEVQKERNEMTVPQLENVAKQLQEFIGKMNRGLEFLVDEESGRDVIKVVDKNSGELIKQYPSEEVLSLVSKLSKVTGSFVDSKI